MRQVGFPLSVLALAAVLLLTSAPPVGAVTPQASSITVSYLFDLGDGSYAWSTVIVPDPAAPNATWDAALAAAADAGVYVRWSWSSSFGVYVTDIGNRSPPVGVGLYLWNATTVRWDALLVGISSLVLHDHDSVAFSDNGFDPATYANLYPVPTPADGYPSLQFRGNAENTGRSGGIGPDLFNLRWDTDLHLNEIASSPATGYGRAYILTLDGLFALNLTSGAIVWRDLALKGLSTPAVYNGQVIFGGSDGRVHSVYASNGTEAWNASLIPNPAFSGVTSSPRVVFDTVYIGTFNESGGAGEVVALGADNGTLLWRTAAPGSVSYSSAAVVDGTLYVGVRGLYNTTTGISYAPPYGLLALDAATGSQRWFFPTGGSVAASPLVVGPEVVVPAADGSVYAVNATTGTLAWKVYADAGVSSPALVGNLIVVGGGSFGGAGRVTALDPLTGATRWIFATNGPVESSVTAAAGPRVFFATNVANGTVYCLNATGGRLDWSYTPSPNQFILSTPALDGGDLLVASDNGHVYEFDAADPSFSSFVTITAPSQIAEGSTANLSILVSAPNGTWEDVQVVVVVPDSLAVVATSPAVSPGGNVSRVNFGPVPFGQTRTFNLTLRANGSAAAASVSISVQVSTLYGWEGGQAGSATIQLAPPLPIVLFILVPIVAIVAVAIVLLLRRRSRRAP